MAAGRGPGGAGRSRFGRKRRGPADPASADAARCRAIDLLSRRDYPRDALKGRLTQSGFETEAAETAVAGLEAERLVNDERFVEAAVAGRTARGQGPRRIALELRRLGVAPVLIEAALDARSPDWSARAVELRRRRFGVAPPADATERARQVRFLLYRGFGGEHIRAAMDSRAADFDDDVDLDALEEGAEDED